MGIARRGHFARPVRAAARHRMRGALLRRRLLFCAALAAPPVPASGRAQAPTSQSPARVAALAGRVTDGGSGAAVSGAVVRLLEIDRVAVADERGTFRIVEVPPGRYTLVVERVGYARQTRGVAVPAVDAAPIDVSLAAGRTELGAVIVRAEKRDEELQRVPSAVSVIDGSRLERERITSPRALTALVPNLVNEGNGSSFTNVTSIRGVNSGTGSPRENAVALYVDEVYQFDPGTTNVQFLDVERVEVLRGPQGTLYGRGAMGGVINVVTRPPAPVATAYVRAEAGSHDLRRLALGGSVPLADSRLFARADGVLARRGGFFTNAFTGRTFDDRDNLSGSAQVRYLATDRLSVDVRLRAERNRDAGSFPWALSDSLAFADPYTVNVDLPNNQRQHYWSSALVARYAGPLFDVVSVTSYSHSYWGYDARGVDIDFSPSNVLVAYVGQEGGRHPGSNYFSTAEELRISSPRGRSSRLDWLAGAFVFRQRYPTTQDIFFADSAVSPAGAPAHAVSFFDQTIDGYAIFGQGTYGLARRLELTLGLRYDEQADENTTRSDLRVVGQPPVTGERQRVTASPSAVTPKASVAYLVSDRVMAYAGVARGYRPGGTNFIPQSPALKTYDPEYLTSYEIGLKAAALNGRVRADLSAFRTRWTDQQVNAIDFTNFQAAIVNAAEATSTGVELEASAIPLAGLRVTYDLGLIRARYDALNLSLDPDAPMSLSGNRQPYTPAATSLLAAEYAAPLRALAPEAELTVGAQWRLLGKQYFDLANEIAQESYGLLDSQIGLRVRGAEVSLWGRNLADRRYLAYGSVFGGNFVLLGDPRTWGVMLSTRVP